MGLPGQRGGAVDEARALAQPHPLAKQSGANACVLSCHLRIIAYIDVDMTRSDPILPAEDAIIAPPVAHARFTIGDLVRHKLHDFRGVIIDIDPVFANSEEWYQAIPQEMRPRKDQPFYHLLAENGESSYFAYVSQQNLLLDDSDEPIDHPAISGIFKNFADGRYQLRPERRH